MAYSRVGHDAPGTDAHARGALAAALVLLGSAGTALGAAAETAALTSLSLEQLVDVQVTSVSKSPELLSRAPAAIHVITEEDIRRSGVTMLTEALRLAPNLRLTQLGAAAHSASARGFGGAQEAQNFSNKLLMLIDGRSVYSPLFSGIDLSSHDVLLSDVSRIEVISGPGSSLWGANAMNGVINVITRPAYLTEGIALSATAGSDRQQASVRYGARWGEDAAYRVYGKAQRSDAMDIAPGTSAEDGWRHAQAGFRLDATHAIGGLTLQGDAYRGTDQLPGSNEWRLTGANLMARLQRQSATSSLQLQAYFDHVQRDSANQEDTRVNTFDIDLQQEWRPGGRHSLVWGAGARVHRYQVRPGTALQFNPERRELALWNLFAQDTIALGEELRATVGVKLEHNSFSGWEPQPELRLAWQPAVSTLLWASAARAIRAPTPFDTDVDEYLGDVHFVEGEEDFRSEKLLAYEAGVRLVPRPSLWLSVSAFYNDYEDLRTVEWGDAPDFLPLRWGNGMHGHTYGLNFWANWQVASWWRLSPGFELLRKRLRFDDSSLSPLGEHQSGNDPRGHARLTSSMDLGRSQLLELSVRHVGPLPQPRLPAYTELSARYAWRATRGLEMSLRGVNLLHRRHREYPAPDGKLIRRGVMLEARWSR